MTDPWPEVCLGEIVTPHRNSVNPSRLGETVVDHYSLPAFDAGASPERVPASAIGSNKFSVPKGAVLVSRLNPHIPRVWAPKLDPSVVSLCSMEFAVLTANGCDPDFLKYFIESEDIYGRLGETMNGTSSSHQRVALDDLLALRGKLPPLATQRRVAELLSLIDERLLVLRSLSNTLSETIKTACEFSIEERKGSDFIPLPQAVRLVNGGAYTKGATGTGRMVIRIKELNSGPSESTVYNDITVPEEKTAYPGDVLFAWSGSLGVWRWYSDEAIVNQHIFKVLAAEHPVWLGWVHILRELETFRDIAAGKATTMGHITKDHLERTQVPVLAPEELEELRQKVEPMWDYQLAIGRQLVALEGLRDFLLSRLVTGELRVPAADDLVGISV